MTISIRSIDIGFDVRAVGQTVMLATNTTAVLCDLPARDGYVMPRKQPVTGTPEKILRSLRGLGYSVRFKI
jgi:hypothetical protein